jgi:hypothetical protein
MVKKPERSEESEIAANKAFGWVFFVLFLIIGILPLLFDHFPRVWALVMAGIFLWLTLFSPNRLRIPQRLWMRFGTTLHLFMTPLFMTVLYILVFLPFGLIMSIIGNLRRSMPLKPDKSASSYWIIRSENHITPESMNDQF